MSEPTSVLSAIILRPDLTDMDKLLWLFILDMAATRNNGIAGDGTVSVSVTRLASSLGRSRGAVSKGVSRLTSLGLIRRTDQKNGANFVYTIRTEYVMAEPEQPAKVRERGGLRVIEGGAA